MILKFPKLTNYQQEAWDFLGDRYREGIIAVIVAPRQCGKSMFCLLKILETAINHSGSCSVIYEPTLNQSRNLYKTFIKMLKDTDLVQSDNGSLLEVELKNGSRCLFKSSEQNSRGFTADLLILDECAWLNDDDIYSILPLVNARNGNLLIVSSPFTSEGYFYTMYMEALEHPSDRLRLFNWSKNPEISRFLTEEKKALYKKTMSRNKYTTEVLGEFLTDFGLLFTRIEENVIEAVSDIKFAYCGIDFGSGSENDFSVLSIFNEKGEMYAIHRTNNLSPMQQVDWLCGLLIDLSKKCKIAHINAEKNSIGSVYIDAMNMRLLPLGIKITEWNTSNSSKQDLVTTFQIALENDEVKILRNDILLNELRRYEAEVSPNSKVIKYNGRNCHDDMVMATLMAYFGLKSKVGAYVVTSINRTIKKRF